MLLSYLLTRNPEWREARILSIASNPLMKEDTELFLRKLIPEIRNEAEIDVMVKPEDVSVKEVIVKESAEADRVLLGLAIPEEGEEGSYARRLFDLAEGLPSCIFVHNGSLFIGELVTPESGDVREGS